MPVAQRKEARQVFARDVSLAQRQFPGVDLAGSAVERDQVTLHHSMISDGEPSGRGVYLHLASANDATHSPAPRDQRRMRSHASPRG